MIQPCPYLPEPNPAMDWRALNAGRKAAGIRHYLTALQYAQVLWLRQLPARALLAIDRAILADLTGNEPELAQWPLPYRAMAWIIKYYKDDLFVGNPRVHFQHLATRVRGERREQRMWRAWACWYLVRQIRPDLIGDAKQGITEPDFTDIWKGLATFGIPDEQKIWECAVDIYPKV